ncbi:unnamed protein product [Symbiodinium sp. CCMP2592]|nr:unnamed protein product [Symbiodinium sp. CCMP2592]
MDVPECFCVQGREFHIPRAHLAGLGAELPQALGERDPNFFQMLCDFLAWRAGTESPGGVLQCTALDAAKHQVSFRLASGASVQAEEEVDGTLKVQAKERVAEIVYEPLSEEEPCPIQGVWLHKEAVSWTMLSAAGKRRLLLAKAAPVQDFEIPAKWQEPGMERLFWAEMSFYQAFELEMAMMSALLRKLLKVYFPQGLEAFAEWQLEAPWNQDVPGGTRLSVEGVRWVLDGDKLFRSRKAEAASGKVTFLHFLGASQKLRSRQLPLNSQHVLLADGLIAGEQTTAYQPEPSGGVPIFDAFRCLLLGVGNGGREVVLQFRCASGPVSTSPSFGTFSEVGDCFSCVEHVVSVGEVCVECTVTSDRLPPFRLDGLLGGSWLVLWCQPMPTPEEICTSGRSSARCFLPGAVEIVDGPSEEGAAACCRDFAAARGRLEVQLASFLTGTRPQLKQWPSKGRIQKAAAHWLALHFWPGKSYAEIEVDWIIATRHHISAKAPDCGRIRKDLERTGFVRREAGGGKFCLLPEKVEQLLLEAEG